MDEAILREKVGQLLSEVHWTPSVEPAAGTGAVQSDSGSVVAMKREMAAVEDSLDHVRLAIKYLVFDLEATRRENRMLREMLGGEA